MRIKLKKTIYYKLELMDEIKNKKKYTKESRKKSKIKRIRIKMKNTTHDKLRLNDEIKKKNYKRTKDKN